jgi:hypothetical protein
MAGGQIYQNWNYCCFFAHGGTSCLSRRKFRPDAPDNSTFVDFAEEALRK